MRHMISRDDIEMIGLGASLLGTGGGGNVHLGRLKLRRILEQGRTVEVIDIGEVPPDAIGIGFSGMGAPTIDVEKIPNGFEGERAVHAVEQAGGYHFRFLVVGEIGGSNALEALHVGAMTGLPVVDADPMGRAFPELQMDTFMIHGITPCPLGLADAHGTTAVLNAIESPYRAEHYARALTVAMGGSAALAFPVVTGEQVRQYAVHGSLSLAHYLGRLMTRHRNLTTLIDGLREKFDVSLLAEGKIVDVERRTMAGFARGQVTLSGPGGPYTILLQNEFLALLAKDRVLASVPDLITVVDHDTGLPISTDQLRYGMRVGVLGIPAPESLKSERALAFVGPAAFDYPFAYDPLPGRYPKAPWFED